MARIVCDYRILFFTAATVFIFIQVRLFRSQNYYDLQYAMKSKNHCSNEIRFLNEKIRIQRGKIAALEEAKKLKEEECDELKALVNDLQVAGKHGIRKSNIENIPIAAVVVMACNRPDYLERTIGSILKYQTSVASKFPLYISQDGSNENVKKKALSYSQIKYMQHLDFQPVHTERPGELVAYYKIAKHYKWALDQLFFKHNFSRVIILEDDMEIAPDFFDYFEVAATLLDNDKSLMAVSSWNDNGQKQFVHDPEALYRSDFFPGLGWMLTRSTWTELSPKWPKAYWDDWLRLKEIHKDRQFIRPEVCRTYNFGEHGSSMGQFFRQYLEPIKLNNAHVDWKSMDLSYLKEDKFLKHFASLVSNANPIYGSNVAQEASKVKGDIRIQYLNQPDYERIARQFGIFDEWKDGIPRTAYKGVVVFRYQTSRRVFLIGPNSLSLLGIHT